MGKSVIFKTDKVEHLNYEISLKDFETAVQTAENVSYPNRFYLYEIYNKTKKDGHLKSVLKDRKAVIRGLDFSVYKNNGKIDNAATDFFYGTWFKKFIGFAVDAFAWGNSLVEIQYNKGKIEPVLVPRVNVIPETKSIKINPYSQTGDFKYDIPAYSNLIDINDDFDNRNLGDLLEASFYALLKYEATINWAQFVELYGQPVRVATTDSEDPVDVNMIEKTLQNMGRAGYIIKNSTTDLEVLQGITSSVTDYDKFIDRCNKEISKIVLNSTMTNEDGSSYNQSKVHQSTTNTVTKDRIKFLESIINDYLIPILVRYGVINKTTTTFSFNEPEIIDTETKLKVDAFLLENFEIDNIDYFSNRYGVKLRPKNTDKPIPNENNTNKQG